MRKLNDYAEKEPSSFRLAKNIVNGILPFGSGPLNQGPTKAGFFDLPRLHAVSGNVSDLILRPDEFIDPHGCDEWQSAGEPSGRGALSPGALSGDVAGAGSRPSVTCGSVPVSAVNAILVPSGLLLRQV